MGGWRLRLAVDRPDLYDLSGWAELGGGSGWGALTAAWLIAARGGLTRRAVWASVRLGYICARRSSIRLMGALNIMTGPRRRNVLAAVGGETEGTTPR